MMLRKVFFMYDGNTMTVDLRCDNSLIRYRIAEEEFGGTDRAEYGTGIIAKLAKSLTFEYGRGFFAVFRTKFNEQWETLKE